VKELYSIDIMFSSKFDTFISKFSVFNYIGHNLREISGTGFSETRISFQNIACCLCCSNTHLDAVSVNAQ
jgi:hypothetical protein